MRHQHPLRKRLSKHVQQSPMFAAFASIGFLQIVVLLWFHRRYLLHPAGHEWRTKAGGVPVVTERQQSVMVPDRWTVVVSVSEGFDDMFSNWHHHYAKLGLQNVELIMVAEDRITFRNYQNRTRSPNNPRPSSSPGAVILDDLIGGYEYDALGRDVLKEQGENVDEVSAGALSHNTAAYNGLVSKRAAHLLRLLDPRRRPLLLYTDVDTVWLSDPRPYLVGEYDMWGPIDSYYGDKNTPYICTGLLAFRSTEPSKRLLRLWAEKLAAEAQLNQPAFNEIWRADTTMRTKVLPPEKFPWGELYFDQGKTEGVVWVHNNYITGKGNKIERFKKAGLWNVDDGGGASGA